MDCDFPVEPITKYHAKNLEAMAGTAATTFASAMTLNQASLTDLLREYSKVDDTDNTGHSQAACAWIKANPKVWEPWIEPWAAPGKANQHTASFYIAVVLGTLVGAVLLWRGGRWTWKKHLRTRPQVMISYRHTDGDFAQQLAVALRAAKYRVWIDTAITPGKDWRQEIALAIQSSIAVVFIVSPGSVNSKYCKEELYYASALRKPVFPVVLKDAFADLKGGMKTILQRIQWIQFPTFDEGFAKLRTQLKGTDKQARKRGGEHGGDDDSADEQNALSATSSATAAVAAKGETEPIATADVYICFDQSDTELAQTVSKVLSARNLNCLLTKHSTRPVLERHGSGGVGSEGRALTQRPSIGMASDNCIEDNVRAFAGASVFVFVLSATSIQSEQCGEELHDAYERDKPMLVVTDAHAHEVPGLLALRGSMGMMIETGTHTHGVISFTDRKQAAAIMLALVFKLLITGDTEQVAVTAHGTPTAGTRSMQSKRGMLRNLRAPSLTDVRGGASKPREPTSSTAAVRSSALEAALEAVAKS